MEHVAKHGKFFYCKSYGLSEGIGSLHYVTPKLFHFFTLMIPPDLHPSLRVPPWTCPQLQDFSIFEIHQKTLRCGQLKSWLIFLDFGQLLL